MLCCFYGKLQLLHFSLITQPRTVPLTQIFSFESVQANCNHHRQYKTNSINPSEDIASFSPAPIYNSRCKTIKTLCHRNTRCSPVNLSFLLVSRRCSFIAVSILFFFLPENCRPWSETTAVSGHLPDLQQLCYVSFSWLHKDSKLGNGPCVIRWNSSSEKIFWWLQN